MTPHPSYFHVLSFDRLGSTSDEAKRLADQGAAAGTLVWARAQDAGRGRQGRAWASPPGNLYCSLLLRPQASAARAAQLSFAASLAVAEACAHFLPARTPRCKWPNDVLIDGRKAAGILLEARTQGHGLAWLVIGIGVNLVSYPEGTETPATSLAREGAAVTAEEMLPILAVRLFAWVEAWEAGFAAIRAAWLGRAEGLGGAVRVRGPREEFSGRFTGLDEDGMLLLDVAEGQRRFAAAEIFPALPGG
jgi:BirA family transcriptional regulator, biotin operon repressor / biotin---[acetyl-CoA-carboxylase] ligase